MDAANLQWFMDHKAGFSGDLKFDEALFRHTYYRIGGPASLLAVPRSHADLEWLAEGISKTQIPFFILGMGSNILVSDEGFSGLVIKVGRLNLEITVLDGPTLDGHLTIRTGSSVAVSTLLRRAALEGWATLECLTGIPGSVGGVVTMNAGTHLGEAKDGLKTVQVYSLSDRCLKSYSEADLQFDYRKNSFIPEDGVIWSVEWEVKQDAPSQVKARIDETLARRKATQPVDYPSCGSVFKNPKASGISAWQVIDKLGLRGHRIGDAQFAEKHSNFIINLGQAKASDVKALIDLAKSRAKTELSIQLEEEVRYLGRHSCV